MKMRQTWPFRMASRLKKSREDREGPLRANISIDGYVGQGDIEHQVGDAKPGVVPAEPIDPVIKGVQGQDLLLRGME